MRSALGPCSNDDRMSLCLAAAVKRCRRTKTRQARTCSLFLPAALLSSCSSCSPGSLLLAPAAAIGRLHFPRLSSIA